MMNVLHKTVMAAVASGALLAAVAQPAEAFTLSAPTPTVAASSDVQDAYYYYGYRPYYHRYYHHYYRPFGFVRHWGYHCWINRWGARVCG